MKSPLLFLALLTLPSSAAFAEPRTVTCDCIITDVSYNWLGRAILHKKAVGTVTFTYDHLTQWSLFNSNRGRNSYRCQDKYRGQMSPLPNIDLESCRPAN